MHKLRTARLTVQELFPGRIEISPHIITISFTRNQTHTSWWTCISNGIRCMTRQQVTVLQSVHTPIARYFYFLRKRLAIISHRVVKCNLHFPLRRRVRASVFTHSMWKSTRIVDWNNPADLVDHEPSNDYRTHLRYSICVINSRDARSTYRSDNGWLAAVIIIA